MLPTRPRRATPNTPHPPSPAFPHHRAQPVFLRCQQPPGH
jgi:hypothetical protein